MKLKIGDELRWNEHFAPGGYVIAIGDDCVIATRYGQVVKLDVWEAETARRDYLDHAKSAAGCQ
jgi:hypothetical protein